MRLWVATGVLCDYTCGMIVIHARSETDAIKTFLEQDKFSFWRLMGTPNCVCHKDDKRNLDVIWAEFHAPKHLPDVFKEIKGSSAHAVSGGG